MFKVIGVIALLAMPFSSLANGIAEEDGTDYSGRILVVTGKKHTATVTGCGVTLDEFKVVAINPGGGGAVITEMGLAGDPSPGDRLDVVGQVSCGDGFLDLTLIPH